MKRLMWLVVLLLVCASVCFAASRDMRTYNGHDWQKMSDEEQLWFLRGTMLGVCYFIVVLANSEAVTEEQLYALSQHIFFSMSELQLQKAVDAYYAQTGNLDMPLYAVVYQWQAANIRIDWTN